MSGLFKFLGMLGDIFGLIRKLIIQEKQNERKRKDEKEQAKLEDIFSDLDK